MNQQFRSVIIIAICGLVAIAAGVVFKGIQSQPETTAISETDNKPITAGNYVIGGKIPDFTVQDTNGNRFQLSQALDGEHFVVINFHHPDCPCSENCSRLINDMMADEGEDITVVGLLSSGYDDQRVLDGLKAQYDEELLQYPVFFDYDQKLKEQFGATRTPEVWVLDKQGVIRYYGAPESTLFPGSKDYRPLLKEAIVAMRQNKTPEVQTMRSIGCPIE